MVQLSGARALLCASTLKLLARRLIKWLRHNCDHVWGNQPVNRAYLYLIEV